MAPAPIAVIVYEPGAAADATLAVLAHGLAARGLRVSGLVQHNDGACALPGFSMALEDIATRRTIPLVDPGIVTPMPAGSMCPDSPRPQHCSPRSGMRAAMWWSSTSSGGRRVWARAA